MTPTPAICAIAMSMKTMPRFSTWIPSGTWVAVTSNPARNAGSRMLNSRLAMSLFHLVQARNGVVEQSEKVLGPRRSAHGVGQFDHRNPGLLGQPHRRLGILVCRANHRVGGLGL